ncbi:NADH dehydrogenase alpha subcomplex subunit 8 [Ramicandelaber brevisporus]|nr:NADH dehydrogenase alpha subcomplex subunit 8 [Ramicandelaber brevisporus]
MSFQFTGKEFEEPEKLWVDPTPMPAEVPAVDEIGASSAPLRSAAFFLGAHCKEYTEDFMLCKAEKDDPKHCLAEGRRVTRCGIDLLKKLKLHCGDSFKQHWECLDNSNHLYQSCRKQERVLNKCALEKLGLEKTIPGAPADQKPIFLRDDVYLK